MRIKGRATATVTCVAIGNVPGPVVVVVEPAIRYHRGSMRVLVVVAALVLVASVPSIAVAEDTVLVKLRDKSPPPTKSKPAAKPTKATKAKKKKPTRAAKRKPVRKKSAAKAKAKKKKKKAPVSDVRPMP